MKCQSSGPLADFKSSNSSRYRRPTYLKGATVSKVVLPFVRASQHYSNSPV